MSHRPSFDSKRAVSGRAVAGLFVVLVLGASTSCWGPEERPIDELVRAGDLFLHPKTMEPYSGLAFATFGDAPGRIAQRSSVRSGNYDGPFDALLENQRLSSKEVYENGVKNGPYEWYFENGQLFEKGTYRDGRLDGPYRAYWENGDLYEEGTYRSGRYDGPRRWYVGGRLIEVVTYRDGVMEGLYERYEEDGTLDVKGMLHAGTPCGMWIERDRAVLHPLCGTRITE